MSALVNGVSSVLKADFDLLRETQNLHGIRKYSDKTIDQLAQYIVCRNYGRICLELCYLCWPIVQLQSSEQKPKGTLLLSFFWLNDIQSPKAFRESISPILALQTEEARWCLDDLGLSLKLKQHQFTTSATRIGLLAAFLEWLVSQYAHILEELEANLIDTDINGISKLASLLQKRMYDLLKSHLPAAGLQQKFRYINSWVEGRCIEQIDNTAVTDVAISVENVLSVFNDDLILNFWRDSKNQEGYIRYQTALVDMLDYKAAVQAKQNEQGFEHATSLSYPLQQEGSNELDSDSTEQLSSIIYDYITNSRETELNYEFLYQSPKALSKLQYQMVANLLSFHASLLSLPLSILRLNTFGPIQALLIQQSRKDKGDNQLVFERLVDKNYPEYLLQVKAWTVNAASMILCCAAVLNNQKDARFLSILIDGAEILTKYSEAFSNKALISELKEMGKKLSASAIERSDYVKVKEATLASPTIQSLLTLASKTLKKNNKAGFQGESHYLDSSQYIASAQALVHCVALIEQWITAIEHLTIHDEKSESAGLKEKFNSDLFIFKDELEKRHGGKND